MVDTALKIKGKRTIKSIEKVTLASVGWNDDSARQFDAFRDAMTSTVQRTYYDPERVTCIWTDANEFNYSLIMTQCAVDELQKDVDEQAHTILVCNSGTFTKSQLRWPMKDKECYPQMLPTWQYEHYLFGKHKPQAMSDHQCLGALFEQAMNPSVVTLTRHKRISRWAMHWLQYDIEFHHIPGTRNGRADVLSRGLAAPFGGVLRMPSDYIEICLRNN